MSEPEHDRPREIPQELGPFRIQGVLGEGGSGVVYAVEHEGQEAALKVPRERELTPRDQERFLEEAKMLERVQHRAIVEVLGSGRLPDGQPYLLMRRYEGETLAQKLARSGALPLSRTLDLFEQLAVAVEALHLGGLLHRDLKPENVMLVSGGERIKLLDFGIAKEIGAPASTTTQAGIARGTPATMAPERFFGAPASTSTDVYELCVVLYAMLVGRLPWTDMSNVQSRLNPLSPAEANPEVPEELANVVMRGLSTRPERRPASISELIEAVRAATRAAGALAPRVTLASRVTTERVAQIVGAQLEPQRSEDAQVIESRRDAVPLERPIGLFIALGVALLALLGVGLFVFKSSSASVDHAAAPSPSAPSVVSALLAPEPKPTRELVPTAAASLELAPAPLAASRAVGKQASPKASPSSAPKTPPTASFPKPASETPAAKVGKPKGAPCTRSSECASMVCAAETCQ